jgi:hypothetical protein
VTLDLRDELKGRTPWGVYALLSGLEVEDGGQRLGLDQTLALSRRVAEGGLLTEVEVEAYQYTSREFTRKSLEALLRAAMMSFAAGDLGAARGVAGQVAGTCWRLNLSELAQTAVRVLDAVDAEEKRRLDLLREARGLER